jgi:hypothetical protein
VTRLGGAGRHDNLGQLLLAGLRAERRTNLLRERAARNSYRFETRIFFRPRGSVVDTQTRTENHGLRPKVPVRRSLPDRGEQREPLGRDHHRAAGPRSPTPGAPYAYVTTPGFLREFGFESLRDLPDIERLQDVGLLGRTGGGTAAGEALATELRGVLGLSGDGEDEAEEDATYRQNYRVPVRAPARGREQRRSEQGQRERPDLAPAAQASAASIAGCNTSSPGRSKASAATAIADRHCPADPAASVPMSAASAP